MSKYILSKFAKEHLRNIYAFGFSNWGETAADTYYNALFDRFENIAENPYLYPSVDYVRKGYRRSVCGKDSIYYRIEDGIVEIVAVLGSQDTDTAL
jgi:toxin ParE1/3/4